MYFQVDNVSAVVDTYREVEAMLHETLWQYNETSRPNTFSFYGQSICTKATVFCCEIQNYLAEA